MNQLAINIAKNVTINELVCTPNTIVLAKQSTTINVKTGDVTTNVRYIEVCTVEKTDALTIVQTLLKYCIAEHFVCKDIETDFADTNITQRKLFNQFLSGNTIYRTNSDGQIANALVSELPLSRTALRVQKTHAVVICKPENRKAAIYQHAKAILAQCQYLRLIINKVETLYDKQAETTETIATTEKPAKTTRKRTHKTTSGATAMIPTAPAMVAAQAV